MVNGTPVAGVPSPPGLDQRGGLHGVGAQGGFGESLKSQELPAMPAPIGWHLPVTNV